MKARRVIYEGRVQGVGFRYAVKDIARGFEVTGSVGNLPDGSVELIVQGELAELVAFLHEIREESALAANIRASYEEDIAVSGGMKGFVIQR